MMAESIKLLRLSKPFHSPLKKHFYTIKNYIKDDIQFLNVIP